MINKYENPLSSYVIKEETKDSKKLKEYWSIGIGLNQVDKLSPSDYLVELAEKHVEGKLNSAQVDEGIREYYADKKYVHEKQKTYECDIVSKRILDLLDHDGFVFSPQMLKNIHGYLFKEFPEYYPGQYRTCEISKKEVILNGESVRYGACLSIENNLQYDFGLEKGYRYQYPMSHEQIKHLSDFISHIWQAHPFREGNTRTTAVFTEMYLRSMGYDVNNDMFQSEALYFRNALVRNNYTNVKVQVYETDEFLNKYFDNLINHAGHQLHVEELYCTSLFSDNKKEQTR